MLHGGLGVVSLLEAEVAAASGAMLQQLLAKLRASIQLPECLRVIGYLRRLKAFSEHVSGTRRSFGLALPIVMFLAALGLLHACVASCPTGRVWPLLAPHGGYKAHKLGGSSEHHVGESLPLCMRLPVVCSISWPRFGD